jgi:hypothetical protein
VEVRVVLVAVVNGAVVGELFVLLVLLLPPQPANASVAVPIATAPNLLIRALFGLLIRASSLASSAWLDSEPRRSRDRRPEPPASYSDD